MATLLEQIANIQSLYEDLEALAFGDENTSATHNGQTRDSLSKAIKGKFDALQAMVQGRLAYETKAAMDAAGAPPAGELAEVVGDSDNDNNGLYYYASSGWEKSLYDPINTAISYASYGRWSVAQSSPLNDDSAVNTQFSMSQSGSGSNSILTVSWSVLRIFDGRQSFSRVEDAVNIDLSQFEAVWIDTENTYIDDDIGWRLQSGSYLGFEEEFAVGKKVLLVANYYGIPIGLLASQLVQSIYQSRIGPDDGRGGITPRIGNAESEIEKISSTLKENIGDLGFHSSQNNRVVYAQQDKLGNDVLRVWSDRAVSYPGAMAMPLPYIDAGTLRIATDDGIKTVSNETYQTVTPNDPLTAIALSDRAGLHEKTRTLVNYESGYAIPTQADVLHVIIVYGQSLSVGAQGTPLVYTDNNTEDALMFSGAPEIDIRMGLPTLGGELQTLDPATLTGFQPLVAMDGQGNGGRGQTIAESMSQHLSAAARDSLIRHRTFWFAPGLGGTAYSGLKKGTTPYSNMMDALARCKELAESEGLKVVVDGLLLVHGEADNVNSNYYNDLIEWQADIEVDVQAITGQYGSVPFMMSQPSSKYSTSHSIEAMLKAHETSSKHFLLGPNYPVSDLYHSDILHFTGPGYHCLGEIFGKATANILFKGSWDCVRIKSAARTGQSVTLTYSTPVPPLVIDTTTVTERDVKGFRYFDSNGQLTITDVQIVSDGTAGYDAVVELTLSETPSGNGEYLDYAMNGHEVNNRTTSTIPRGNIRDSESVVSSYDGRTLSNWAVHQEIEVTVE